MESANQNNEKYRKAFKETTIVFAPSLLISLFGETNYNYYFLSAKNERSTIVREGVLHIFKPLIFTFSNEDQSFSGFPHDTREEFKKFLKDLNLNMLEYQFKLVEREKWEEKMPVSAMISEIKKDFQKQPSTALLIGNEKHWEISLLKLCFKVVEKSTPLNLKELLESQKKTSISLKEQTENIFEATNQKKKTINQLAKFLLENQLFEQYEERFFTLVKKLKS